MRVISSEKSERIRRVQALVRSTRRRVHANEMVVEGEKCVRELVNSSVPVHELFINRSVLDSASVASLLTKVPDSICNLIDDQLFALLSDTQTPQGVLAVCPIPQLPAKTEDFILIADSVRDPGNLGTILRTAWAVQVSQVLITENSVDFSNPKVVRAGMGAHFHVPIRSVSWEYIEPLLKQKTVWLAEAHEGVNYELVNWCGDLALIVGGEASGASESARTIAQLVSIPMAGGIDSLNVAIAASVLLFEAAKQRRHCT